MSQIQEKMTVYSEPNWLDVAKFVKLQSDYLAKAYETAEVSGDFWLRLFNVVVALIVGIVASPIMLLAALVVFLADGQPIIYRQKRLGLLGREFTLYKFRTMKIDAEKDGARLAQQGDSRVTPVGMFMRKTRIDELPQLLNVIKGDMNIVGPRPERPEFYPVLEKRIEGFSRRLLVRPGITGLAQVRYGYASDISGSQNKLRYDLLYIAKRSFFLDVKIIIRTVKVVFSGFGAR
ncbi:MAG: sugar transferase [Bdellovibrionales bacterium]|nr:sugar transferase [Bdellovibrionales bacterium]